MNTSNYPTAGTNTGSRASEGVAEDYYIEIDGNNGKYKVMDLDHPKWAKSEGLVEITPLKFSKGLPNARTGIVPQRHENSASFGQINDITTGYIVGIPTGRNEKGEIIWRKQKFGGPEILNLANKEERRRFIIFKYSPIYIHSPNFLKGSKTEYGLNDREAQNEKFFAERTYRVKAGAIASSLRGEDLIEAALLIGLDPNTMTNSDVQRKVIEFAESNDKDKVTGKTGSQTFLEMWESPNRVEWTTFKRALSTGVIIHDMQNGTYNYRNLPIGRTEEEVISYFNRSPVQYTTIDMESKKVSLGGTKTEDVAPVVNIRNAQDAENALLRERLAALEKQNLELSKRAVKEETEEKLSEEDPEIYALIKELSEYKPRGAHLVGRKDTREVRIQKLNAEINKFKKSKEN